MHTTRYTLETVTPLFLRGPDGETPELRPPSFKGMLRYWWRALHPMPVDDLRAAEGRRFGSAGNAGGGQSPVRLRLRNRDLDCDKYLPVPTHDFERCAYSPNQQFDLQITVHHRAEKWEGEIEATVRLMILLGGMGWRARRGMGSLRLVAVDGKPVKSSLDALEEVESQLTRLKTPFKRHGRKISHNGSHSEAEGPPYPWVRSIETGIPAENNDWRSVVQRIAEIASKNDSHYTGNHKNPRLSSPLFVTVGKEGKTYWPLLTSLNLPSSMKQKLSDHRGDTRASFRDALL